MKKPTQKTVVPTVGRSNNMRAIRAKHTKPERAVRSALHRAGFRFRLHVRDLPGKPDMVLPKYSAVVEVRGCFWHGHSCADGHIPASNQSYWIPKLSGTKKRDRRNVLALKKLGYRVKVVWECEVSTQDRTDRVVGRISSWLKAQS